MLYVNNNGCIAFGNHKIVQATRAYLTQSKMTKEYGELTIRKSDCNFDFATVNNLDWEVGHESHTWG